MSLTLFGGQRLQMTESIDLTIQSLQAYGPRHRHWAIAWSGGKDSTTLLTLVVWLLDTGKIARPETLSVLYADTRMELLPLWVAAAAIREERTLQSSPADNDGLGSGCPGAPGALRGSYPAPHPEALEGWVPPPSFVPEGLERTRALGGPGASPVMKRFQVGALQRRRDPRLAELSDALYRARQRHRQATSEERRAHWQAEITRLLAQREEVRAERGLPTTTQGETEGSDAL